MFRLATYWVFSGLLALAVAGAPLHASDVAGVPTGTSLIGDDWMEAFELMGPNAADATVERVRIQGQPFDRALRITTHVEPPARYGIQIRARTVEPLQRDDVVLIRFALRCIHSESETSEGSTSVLLETLPEFKKTIWEGHSAGVEWRTFYVHGKVREDADAGGMQVTFRFGFKPQTVELGGVSVLNLGRDVDRRSLPNTPVTYAGREPDAAWRAAAAEGIERHRKADLAIRVVDQDGRPIEDATVDVRMTRHRFAFGAIVTARYLTEDSEDGRHYRDIIRRHYNRVVLENDLKWGPFESGKLRRLTSPYNRDWLMRSLQWLQDHDIELRGHWVSYAVATKNPPYEQYHDQPQVFRQKLHEHIEEKLTATRGLVHEWDVINHLVGWDVRLHEVMGTTEIYSDIIRQARELQPGVRMWVNEGVVLTGAGYRIEPYHDMIQLLYDQGTPPDGIGFMGHFGGASLTHPARIAEIYDRFSAAFGLPLQVTEFDVNVIDEQVQAEYLRDFMTVTFGHPAVEGIVMWGVWEGRHWQPDAALYRKDWSIKPAGEAWNDLVLNQWWTEERGATDADGRFGVRGFQGDYEVTAVHGGRFRTERLSLPPEGSFITIALD